MFKLFSNLDKAALMRFVTLTLGQINIGKVKGVTHSDGPKKNYCATL